MAQKTVIIGTDNTETATLVRDIPRCWIHDSVRYVVISSSGFRTSDGNVDGLYDIHLHSAIAPEAFGAGIATVDGLDALHVYFTRHPKDQQAAAINKIFAGKPGFHEFWPLRTWTDIKDMPQHRQGIVVLRPKNGARGIGQLVYDTRLTNFMSIQGALLDIRNNPIKAGKESSGKILEADRVDPRENVTAFNKTLAEKFAALPGSPVWYSDGDRTVSEGWDNFRDFFVQEYVTNISKEYRIIIGGDNQPVYVIERDRPVYAELDDVQLASASSARVGIGKHFTTLQAMGLPQAVVDGFTAILREKDFSLYSFDVFVTKDGQWGIFEFSNEFGTESVPNGLVCTEIQKYIHRVTQKN